MIRPCVAQYENLFLGAYSSMIKSVTRKCLRASEIPVIKYGKMTESAKIVRVPKPLGTEVASRTRWSWSRAARSRASARSRVATAVAVAPARSRPAARPATSVRGARRAVRHGGGTRTGTRDRPRRTHRGSPCSCRSSPPCQRRCPPAPTRRLTPARTHPRTRCSC